MLPEMNELRANAAHYLWLTIVLVIIGLLIYWLGPILAPFLTAATLAYICDPLVDRLQRHKVPRALATSLVLLLLIALLVLLLLIILPVFYREIALLVERLPDLLTRLKTSIAPWLKQQFDIELQLDVGLIRETLAENWQKAGGIAGKLLSSVRIGGLAVVGFLVNLILVPVVTFYLLRDWDKLVADVAALIPRRWHERVSGIVREIDSVLAEFMRGQLLVMLIMAVYYSAGLAIAGLQFALPIGIISGLLVFVPFVGSITGLLLSLLAAARQFTSLAAFGGVIAVFVIGQLIEGYIVTPRFVGDRIGLHPVAVIFALLAFGELFGFVGVLLALPLAAVVLVGLRHARREYIASNVYHS